MSQIIGWILLGILILLIVFLGVLSIGSIFFSETDSRNYFCGEAGTGIVWERESFLGIYNDQFSPMTAPEYFEQCEE